ncbi:hypothetical protein V1509DRAFT_613602 [Lipomyces kononenkoae]
MQREHREHFFQNHMYPGYLMQQQLPLPAPGQLPYTKPYNSTSVYPLQNTTTATPQQRYSSPINEAEDDADILALFFNWKISNTRNDERRIKWQQARDLVLQNDWSIRDLQQMENGMSAMYQRAIQAGISDGFARSFRTQLNLFKSYYRQRKEKEAAAVLNSLGGGFIPGDVF